MDFKKTKDDRPMCKYSPNCYQKNPEHIKKFKHEDAPKKNPQNAMKNFSIFDFAQKNKKRKLEDEKSDVASPPSHTAEEPKAKRLSEDGPSKSPKDDLKVKQNGVVGYHERPEDVSSFILEKFCVKMPEDFYKFWDFFENSPRAKNIMRKVNLDLVGPFDVFVGKLPLSENSDDYLLHWRHYYDPPEFQTIIMSTKSEFHIGYFRDRPEDNPCFVASNSGTDCKISPLAENIFGALVSYFTSKDGAAKNVFLKSELDIFVKELKDFAEKNDFTLDTNTAHMKTRQRAVVTKTFHGAGIVVPYDKKTQLGYRPLIEKDDKIKTLLKILVEAENDKERASARSALQPIVTMANIANDECDFGTGLELGIDMFCYGSPILHGYVENCLGVAYSMLDRDSFGNIITAHLKNRRKGSKLSMADLK